MCALLLMTACTDDGDDAGNGTSSTTSTVAPATSTSTPATSTSMPTVTTAPAPAAPTWTGVGFASLEWGASRTATIATLTDLLGPPVREAPNECGQDAEWPGLVASFTDDGRLGTLHVDLAEFAHDSGLGVGDRIGDLQSAGGAGSWEILGVDGLESSTGRQTWTLRRDDIVTFGFASAPEPDGLLERPVVQYSVEHEAPPCGD